MTDQRSSTETGELPPIVSAPVDPTKEMAEAGRKALALVADRMETAKLTAVSVIDFWQQVGHEPANEIYRAMLDVRPGIPAQQTQWQLIETAPKHHGLYLDLWMPGLSGEYVRVPDCKWLGDERQPGWYAECDEGAYYVGDRATHWMYRPESPALPSTDLSTPPENQSHDL